MNDMYCNMAKHITRIVKNIHGESKGSWNSDKKVGKGINSKYSCKNGESKGMITSTVSRYRRRGNSYLYTCEIERKENWR